MRRFFKSIYVLVTLAFLAMGQVAVAQSVSLEAAWKYFRESEFKKAEKTLSILDDQDVKIDSFYLLRAHLCHHAEDYDEAFEALDSALVLNNDCDGAYILRGIINYELREFGDAFSDFNAAIYINPLADTAYHYRSILRLHADDLNGAAQDATLCFKLNTTNTSVLIIKTVALAGLHRKDDAFKTYQTLERLRGNDSATRMCKAQLLAAFEEYDHALVHLTSMINDSISVIFSYKARSLVKLALHDSAGAIGDISRAIDYDEEDPELFLARGYMHLHRGDTSLALEDFDAALEIEPDNPVALYSRGALQSKQGQYAKATEDYLELFRSLSIIPDILNSPTENADEDFAQADAELTAALLLDPRNPNIYFRRGKARYYEGKILAAVADLDEAIELDNAVAEYYQYKGMAFDEMGKYEMAIRLYDTALVLDPSSANVYHYRGW